MSSSVDLINEEAVYICFQKAKSGQCSSKTEDVREGVFVLKGQDLKWSQSAWMPLE